VTLLVVPARTPPSPFDVLYDDPQIEPALREGIRRHASLIMVRPDVVVLRHHPEHSSSYLPHSRLAARWIAEVVRPRTERADLLLFRADDGLLRHGGHDARLCALIRGLDRRCVVAAANDVIDDARFRVWLVPDFNALGNDFFAPARAAVGSAPWRERADRLIWRGVDTGQRIDPEDPRSLPRARLCQIARGHPLIDAALTDLVQTPAADRPALAPLLRPRLSIAEMCRARYQIDIDGNGSAWEGGAWTLASGSTLLRVASPLCLWWHRHLRPGEHYHPVRADLSDLIEVLETARANPTASEQMAHRARTQAHALLNDAAARTSCGADLDRILARPR
jgi:hypothetical protein